LIEQNKFFDKRDMLFSQILDNIIEIAETSITSKGSFRIVLAGGDSPKPLYKLLLEKKIDFTNWIFYLGDERVLSKKNYLRNDYWITKNFISLINTPKDNIFFLKPELGSKYLENYKKMLKGIDKFDLVLLGMGIDGHTASIFPNRQYRDDIVIATHSPVYPFSRLSYSLNLLSNSQNIIKIVIGKSKAKAFYQWQNGYNLPIASVKCQNNINYICFD